MYLFPICFHSVHDPQTPNSHAGAGSFSSRNPLLKNITDYLVDEADAEEEELLGLDSDKPKNGADEVTMGRNYDLTLFLCICPF